MNRGGGCFNCGGNHIAAHCDERCRRCQRSNHAAKDCPNRRNARGPNNPTASSHQNNPRNPRRPQNQPPQHPIAHFNTAEGQSSRQNTVGTSNNIIAHEQLDPRSGFDKQAMLRYKTAKEVEVNKGNRLEVHELRPSFVGPPKPDFVLTNHFSIKLPDTLYHYMVEGMEDDARDKTFEAGGTDHDPDELKKKLPSGATQRLMMEKVIDADENLKLKKTLYASDRMRQIVSWIKPADFFERDPVAVGTTLVEAVYTVRRAVPEKNLDAETKTLRLQYKGEIRVRDLLDASHGTRAYFSIERESANTVKIEQALNMIIMKATLASSPDLFRVGSNKIFTEDGKQPLSPGVFAHHGFFSTIKVGMGCPLLNVSSATSAFFEALSVRRYLQISGNDYESLKNVKVEVTYAQGKTRTIKAFGLRKSPRTQEFSYGDNEEEITVLDYLRTKNVDETLLDQVAISDHPCANMGTDSSPEWYPVEALRITKHQNVKKLSHEATEVMLSFASKLPQVNLENIVQRGLSTLGISSQDHDHSVLHAAGIKVSDKPLKIPFHMASFYSVQYNKNLQANLRSITDNSKRWNIYNRQFYDVRRPFQGRIVILLPKDLYDTKGASEGAWVADHLSTEMSNTGIRRIGPEQDHVISMNLAATDHVAELRRCFTEARSKQTGLVVLVNPDPSKSGGARIQWTARKGTVLYNQFKRVADQTFGMHTTCTTEKNLYEHEDKPKPYFANITMKVNIKLGNVNHTVQKNGTNGHALMPMLYNRENEIDTIILGADVTHAQKDSKETTRSLAALVGSVDDTFGQFGGSVRYQTQNQEVSLRDHCNVRS